MIKQTTLTLLGTASLIGMSTASTISLVDLSALTATETYSTGEIADNGASGFDQYTGADVTFAFTVDLGATSGGAVARTLFEFGGGSGTGISLNLRKGLVAGKFEIIFAHETGLIQIGGNSSSLISILDPNTADVDVVASIAFGSGNATLNLFVDGIHIGSDSGVSSDWAGVNHGGYDATGESSVLAPNFSNGTWGGASEINASYDTDLSLYSGVAVTLVPEPSSAALLGLGGLALIMRRRK